MNFCESIIFIFKFSKNTSLAVNLFAHCNGQHTDF